MKSRIIGKFARKFSYKEAKSESNILAGIHYAADKSVFITNRHYGIRIKNAHQLQSPVTIHTTKGVPLEGNYPNLDRFFEDSYDLEITLLFIPENTVYVKFVSDIATKINRKYPIASLWITDGGELTLTAQTKDGIAKCEVILSYTDVNTNLFGRRLLNANLAHTALEVFAETNAKQVTLKTNNNTTSPIILSDNNDIDIIILPYRTPE